MSSLKVGVSAPVSALWRAFAVSGYCSVGDLFGGPRRNACVSNKRPPSSSSSEAVEATSSPNGLQEEYELLEEESCLSTSIVSKRSSCAAVRLG